MISALKISYGSIMYVMIMIYVFFLGGRPLANLARSAQPCLFNVQKGLMGHWGMDPSFLISETNE